MDKVFITTNPKVGFVYAPYQAFKDLYNWSDALKNGTIFKELNIPFSEYSANPIMNPFK
jgi:hypothetical protein